MVNQVTFVGFRGHDRHNRPPWIRPRIDDCEVRLHSTSGVGGGWGASAPSKVLICKKSVKIWAKSMKMFAKSMKTWANSENGVKNGAQRCLIWKNGAQYLDIFSKIGFHDLCGRKYSHKKLPETFQASLGKFRQKSFTPPKFAMLLHPCILPNQQVFRKFIDFSLYIDKMSLRPNENGLAGRMERPTGRRLETLF